LPLLPTIFLALPLVAQFGPTAPPDPAIERGRQAFISACAFCHGTEATGRSAPDLVRSSVVLHDEHGDQIGPVILNGRPERGMPAFNYTPEQIADLAAFLHSRAAAASNRFSYTISGLLTGDAVAGKAFFYGTGKCSSCHSTTGDLQHIAAAYEAVDLQRRMIYPVATFMDSMMGKKTKPAPPVKVTVVLPSGQTESGVLEHKDEFKVVLKDASGQHRVLNAEGAKVTVDDPLAAHEQLMAHITDRQMHDTLAFLETLK
jgi:cytochrome c oxidase cbb3-type subunit 3